jgi:hypothetical protein
MRIADIVTESTLGNVLTWPEVVNKINSAMKATGWKGQRQSDDAFMFSVKGQETDDQFYFVIIENAGEGFFSYALGTVEEGDPYIDDAYRGKLPNTEASVSELINKIREGFGLNEEQLNELTFMGSQCTKDCSGHRAGYNWSVARGRKSAASWSNSFNKGAELAATGH